MGSYSKLYLSDYPLFWTKNSYYEDVVSLIFLESDYIEFEQLIRNEMPWGDIWGSQPHKVKAFRSSSKICRKRLEIFGASYLRAKLDFETALRKIGEDNFDSLNFDLNISFEIYLDKIKVLIQSKGKDDRIKSKDNFDSYLLDNDLLIEYQSIELGLWCLLSVVDSNDIVEYDLTELVNGGWVEEPAKKIDTRKIIVLTEGKTDTEFLKIGLNHFFPYLVKFYHFMDFENSRYEANASRLVHTIKSFVGSGIKNQIIAIFDNDSAAKNEIKNLRNVQLPSNIKVLQYPEIEWAKKYPTIGPSGIQEMDINGLAGSIELYLGKDCLKENGKFLPIQWMGYIDSINQYQGVIKGKDKIQRAFRKKAKIFDKSDYDKEQWMELISIITLIRNAWK